MTEIIQFSSGMSKGFFVKCGDSVVLVDTGFVKGLDDFKAHCEKAGIKPEQIKLIVVSHEHNDHFMYLDVIKDFLKVPVMCHKNSFESLSKGLDPTVKTRDGSPAPGDPGRPRPKMPVPNPKVTPDILVGDEGRSLEDYGVEARLIYTPGHSAGSMTLLTEDAAIIGDIIISNPDGSIRTAKFADDEAALKNSVMDILAAAPKTIYSGHADPVPVDEFLAIYEEEWAAEDK